MEFYDEDFFSQSSTYNSWVRLLCADFGTLVPFSEVFDRRARRECTVRGEEVYFFQNHPINYVTVVATCGSFEELSMKRSLGLRNRVFMRMFERIIPGNHLT